MLNNSNSAPNVEFWEYGSTDLTGAPLDVSQRLNVSRQITAAEAAQWSDPGFVLGGWVPFTVNAGSFIFSDGAAFAGTFSVGWSAPVGHSADDWIGLYAAGSPDANPLSKQTVGSATTGHPTFQVPGPGTYEFRYFLSDGVTRKAVSNQETFKTAASTPPALTADLPHK